MQELKLFQREKMLVSRLVKEPNLVVSIKVLVFDLTSDIMNVESTSCSRLSTVTTCDKQNISIQ